MTHTFDERGEAAIVNLRRDPRFNEALYRNLGPVLYWTEVRAAEERVRLLKRANGQPTIDPPQGHSLPRRPREPIELTAEEALIVGNFGNGIPLEKASKERSKAVNIAAGAILISLGFAVAAVVITVAVMICYGLWSWVF